MTKTARRTSLLTRATLLVLTMLLTAAASAGAQSRYSGFVVFGTSLSDPGNAFVLSGDAAVPPDFTLNPLLVPSSPYAKGGHHFSNGSTWIEQYARSVGLGDSVKAALATIDPSVNNYAVGAARAYNDGKNFNLTLQVDTFLQRSGGVASPRALYVIEMGGNDVRDALGVYAVGGDGGPIIGQAIGSISTNIQRLYAAGARDFLVWSAPNVGLTPALRSLGPVTMGFASQIAQGFNGGLTQVLGFLSAALPGSSFARLDAYQLLGSIVGNPSSFGLTNVTTACVTPNAVPYDCSTPDVYLFWDGIHPTKVGHAIIAQEAANVIR